MGNCLLLIPISNFRVGNLWVNVRNVLITTHQAIILHAYPKNSGLNTINYADLDHPLLIAVWR